MAKRKTMPGMRSRTDPSIFNSIAPALLERANGAVPVFPALKSMLSQLKNQEAAFRLIPLLPRRSDSTPKVNSSCCY